MYDEIWSYAKIASPGMIRGNGKTAIQYDANGEASDWMLGEHGIVAISPELGTNNKQSDHFVLTNETLLKHVIQTNDKWI